MTLATTLATIVIVGACSPEVARAEEQREQEPVIGLPCEGCEAVFVGLPQPLSSIPTRAVIGDSGERAEPLRIEGVVLDLEGDPAPGVIVYAYHTDDRGIYPRDDALKDTAAYRHGSLRGWARTDESGVYAFDTTRPAGYPDSRLPQHIHMHIIEPGCCTYYIDDILFDDDPRLTDALRRNMVSSRGGAGLVTPARSEDGRWFVQRDIVLGLNIPDHPNR